MNYFFSIVIPLFNKENYILKTLDSVLKQEYKNFEVIVINDGSTDHSLEKVNTIKDSRIRVISQKNQGVSAARNNGITKAKGQYIALLDADDYWYPHHLSSLKQLIELFPNAGVYCDAYEIIMQNKTTRKADFNINLRESPQIIDNYFEASLVNPIIWTSSAAFSKDKFQVIGPFDVRLRTAQDLDFFARAALKFSVAFQPKVGMRYYKDSENNLAKSKYNSDRFYFISKYKLEERQHPSLKNYLDINRYALVIRCKLEGDILWKKVISEIDPLHLNNKQKFLLKLPPLFLRFLKTIQVLLMKRGMYLTAFG
ncbi:glycosyltransferase family 2 protein [Psychroflexus lacisalsi]|uniref:Glycosyltransferase family 2 protein n=1 Tax=Psychroflexus lacisalsi TaxID=503928 RepID=A0ABN1K8E6_9FLAO|nr:glycosyltransferase [Psychroflexus lacisalsi]MBZ9619633.1 glycosyltransferase [Psychroflexus lacisalsi]